MRAHGEDGDAGELAATVQAVGVVAVEGVHEAESCLLFEVFEVESGDVVAAGDATRQAVIAGHEPGKERRVMGDAVGAELRQRVVILLGWGHGVVLWAPFARMACNTRST